MYTLPGEIIVLEKSDIITSIRLSNYPFDIDNPDLFDFNIKRETIYKAKAVIYFSKGKLKIFKNRIDQELLILGIAMIDILSKPENVPILMGMSPILDSFLERKLKNDP
jgi:hypothetical protein